jgi:hypothetical protein
MRPVPKLVQKAGHPNSNRSDADPDAKRRIRAANDYPANANGDDSERNEIGEQCANHDLPSFNSRQSLLSESDSPSERRGPAPCKEAAHKAASLLQGPRETNLSCKPRGKTTLGILDLVDPRQSDIEAFAIDFGREKQ